MVASDVLPMCAEHTTDNGPASMTSTTTTLVSSEQPGATDERRFVWYQKEEVQRKLEELRYTEQRRHQDLPPDALPASSKLDAKDFKDKVRAGAGAKGKTGSTDFTRGKNAFVRPCTVGWKSQNQPLARGGGNRTPRQKG
jgi:hypothetical protein